MKQKPTRNSQSNDEKGSAEELRVGEETNDEIEIQIKICDSRWLLDPPVKVLIARQVWDIGTRPRPAVLDLNKDLPLLKQRRCFCEGVGRMVGFALLKLIGRKDPIFIEEDSEV